MSNNGVVSSSADAESFLPAETLLDNLADALAGPGYALYQSVLPAPLVDALARELAGLPDDRFRPAGIGREDGFQLDHQVRRDRIHWLGGHTRPQRDFLAIMEAVRLGLNRRLFLGLFDYECHYASYAEGAFYKKHLDAFRQPAEAVKPGRVLSTVLYLNHDWQPADGGELLLYQAPDAGKEDQETPLLEKILPRHGRLLVFLSEHFPHEVAMARRERHSIAGWFRTQGRR